MMLVTSSSPRRHVFSPIFSPNVPNDSSSGTPTVAFHSVVDTSSTAFQDQGRVLSSMQ